MITSSKLVGNVEINGIKYHAILQGSSLSAKADEHQAKKALAQIAQNLAGKNLTGKETITLNTKTISIGNTSEQTPKEVKIAIKQLLGKKEKTKTQALSPSALTLNPGNSVKEVPLKKKYEILLQGYNKIVQAKTIDELDRKAKILVDHIKIHLPKADLDNNFSGESFKSLQRFAKERISHIEKELKELNNKRLI